MLMLGVVGSNLTIFKLEPTTPNMAQHIATRWPNARNMLRLFGWGFRFTKFLFYQLQPVPPSPGAARKISFNGLKETIVLPQQAGK